MAVQSGFFNSVNHDRRYDATWFAEYFATFIGNGIFPNPSNTLQVLEYENMDIAVYPGKGWILGYWAKNDSLWTTSLDPADGVLDRIDRVVLGLNYSERTISIYVKKGVLASIPVAPDLQRDGDAYELALADILVAHGVTGITQSAITDQRLNDNLCGIVHGLVEQVDTTTIFNQYQTWLEETKASNITDLDAFKSDQEADFNTWFENIKGMLDGDIAGNLADRIDGLEQFKASTVFDNEVHGLIYDSSTDELKYRNGSSLVNIPEPHSVAHSQSTVVSQSLSGGNLHGLRVEGDNFFFKNVADLWKQLVTILNDGSIDLLGPEDQYYISKGTKFGPNVIESFSRDMSTGENTTAWEDLMFKGASRYLFDSVVAVTTGSGDQGTTLTGSSINTDFVFLKDLYIADSIGGGEYKYQFDCGRVSVPGGSDTVTSAHVNFDTLFTSDPQVIVSAVSTVPYTGVRGVSSGNITTSGFDCYTVRNNTTNTSCSWFAINREAL